MCQQIKLPPQVGKEGTVNVVNRSSRTLSITTNQNTMNLQETIQEQIDDVMDTFDFERCSEALRLVECCWLNDIYDEGRVYQIRRHGRERMKSACAMATTAYEALRNDPEEMIYEMVDSGCLIGYCSIYTGDKEEKPWVKVNLTCYIDNSLNDGKDFE